MVRVALALGSNLGDREGYLRDATARLAGCIANLRVSTFHETEPVGVGQQPRFLNAAAAGETALSARALLDEMLAIERRLGRERPYAGAPRTIDLDLILYGDAVIDEQGLVVPHPRFRERAFVLEPLSEIVENWVDPVSGLTIGQLHARLTA